MFFQNDKSGRLELESLHDIGVCLGSGFGLDTNDDVSTDHVQVNSTVILLTSGGEMTWNKPVIIPNTR